MGGNALKENFYGVWGQKREEYLRTDKPEEYDSLVSSGELEDYLADYQEEYSILAEKMFEELASERGIDEQLYKKDALKWILESEKIQEEVQSKLEKEIQQ